MNKHWIGLATTIGVLAIVTSSTLPMIVNAEAGADCPRENRCVRIDVEVKTEDTGTGSVVVRSSSLGTVVAPGLILTHNHHAFLDQRGADVVVVLTESTGTSWLISLSDLTLLPLDAGTLLIQLPEDVTLTDDTRLTMALDPSIQPGDWLNIAYRRPTTGSIERASFEVVQVLADRIRLADPQHLIQPGSSGGGAYLGDRLIGNTWSIDKVEGQAIGSFTVALLPEALPAAVAALAGTRHDRETDTGDEDLMGWAK